MAEGRVIVVAGPTASGKSALALALALALATASCGSWAQQAPIRIGNNFFQ